MRLTDDRTAKALKEISDKLKAGGFEVDVSNERYIKLAEYESKETDIEKETRTKIYNEILDSNCKICPCRDLKHCTSFDCYRHNILAIVDGDRWYKEIKENPRYKRIWLEKSDADEE